MQKQTTWLTLEELHRKWDISYGTINKWRKDGLPWYQVGKNVRFKDDEVEEWITQKLKNGNVKHQTTAEGDPLENSKEGSELTTETISIKSNEFT
jgi:excisionase family DNA binding protein